MSLKRKSGAARLSASSDDSDGEPDRVVVEEGGLQVGDIYIPPPPPAVCSMETGAPRLMIMRIVNKNFKSYAGIQELGPFHKCFTSIIGPNGSGKSNVIDSMLFVFGYRGSKIRTKKISSLIHNSENYKNIQACTVSVYFKLIIDKDEDYEEVPNSQFYVSRTGFKDNSSTYEIDGRRVPFKEVAVKLKKFGIDLDHNRFLILQGEVEQIAMMKPKGLTEHDSGMLEYLEDIIGTSRFKEPIEKLQVVVNELSEDRLAKVQKVELVGKERNDMQDAYEEAIDFLKTENYITELRNTEYQKYIYDTELNKKQKEEKRNEVKTELETNSENIKECMKKRKQLEDELKGKQEVKTKLQEKLQNLKDLYKQIETKDNQARTDMVKANDRRKKSNEKLAEEKRKLNDLEEVPEKNAAKIKEIEKKLPKLEEEIENLNIKQQQIKAETAELTKPLRDQCSKKETELVQLRQNQGKAQHELGLAEKQLQVFIENEKRETEKLENIRATYENSEKTLKEKQKFIEEHNKIFPPKDEELQKSSFELLQLNNERKRLQEQIYSLEGKIEESRSSMQRTQFRNRILNYLMDLKDQGVLPGILGRLGDLGAIDPKYDVAVSTACGPLDYIVVDTIETANKCVQALKAKNIGRGNFMPLDKLEYLRQDIKRQVQTPENIPRLFDLIQMKDKRLELPFYFGVRDTLVANDLEQATRIAYGKSKRYRVVTLGGDLIELVGTMSGGGRNKISGRMGSKILVDTTASNSTDTPDRIERYERDVQEFKDRLRNIDNSKYDLESNVNLLTKEVEKMRSDLRRYVADCEAVKINLPNLKKQIKDQEKIVQNVICDKNHVKELELNTAQKRELFEKEKKIAEKLQEEVDELKKEISLKEGDKLSKVQNNIKEISQTIKKLKTEMTKLTVGINNSERNIVKCKETIANIEESIENEKETILQLQKERDGIEVDAKKLVEKIENIEKDLNEIKADEGGAEIKNDINELSKSELKLKQDKINLEHELNTIKQTIKEYENNLSHWAKTLSKLTLHDIPNNEVQIERLEQSTNTSKQSINSSVRTTQKKELRVLSDEELENCNVADIQYTITLQQDKLKKKPNLNVIEEYKKVQLEYCKRVRDVEEVTQRRNLYRETLDKAKKQRESEFLTGYQTINLKLKEMYQMITLGGDAELELVDSLDPFNDGISFSVRPPKKSWKNICNLSGGEKTLSSLALVFALHYYKPSPLYVMDEIDAALDFKNVSIVANYIKDRTKNAQFIIISLRSNMFELADRLVGIYKTYNCTKSCAVNPRGLHEILLNSLNTLQIHQPTNQQLSQAIVQSQQTQDPATDAQHRIDNSQQ